VKKPVNPVENPGPKPVNDPPPKPVEAAPPAPAEPELEADDPAPLARDANASAKNQADSGWGMSWVPVAVFVVVTVPLLGALLLVYGKSKQPTPEFRKRRPRSDDQEIASDLSPRRSADEDDRISTSRAPKKYDVEEPWDYPPVERFDLEKQGKNGLATTSLVLGSIGLLAWCLPILGLPITITGLVMGVKGLQSYKQGAAVAGIVLNIVGLLLSLMNAALGAFLAVANQPGHFR
jgi:hypothetical protein